MSQKRYWFSLFGLELIFKKHSLFLSLVCAHCPTVTSRCAKESIVAHEGGSTAPAGPPPQAAAPKAAPATGPTPSPPATTGGEENNREESDRVLRDRERSWADASEELEEARRESVT